jgi:hypothetical protein
MRSQERCSRNERMHKKQMPYPTRHFTTFHIFIHQTNNKLISTFYHVSHFLIRQANNQSQHALVGILASHISHRSLLICSYSSYHEVQAIFSQKILCHTCQSHITSKSFNMFILKLPRSASNFLSKNCMPYFCACK